MNGYPTCKIGRHNGSQKKIYKEIYADADFRCVGTEEKTEIDRDEL